MNRIYKVIFNRNRNLVQVVPEYARSNGKEVSASRHDRVRGLARVLLGCLAALMIASPGYAADGDTTTTATDHTAVVAGSSQITVTPSTENGISTITYTITANPTGTIASGDTGLLTGGTVYTELRPTSGTYISVGNTTAANLIALDTHVKSNADAISAETTARTTTVSAEASAREAADTALTNKIGTIADGNYVKATDSVATNLGTLDTQVKTNADAISAETTARTTAVSDEATARTNADTTLTNAVSAEETARKAADTALSTSIGSLSTDGYYIKKADSVYTNMSSLDTNLNKALTALGVDTTSDSTYVSKLSKYFKVNPEITTADDGTQTYATDASVDGTNSIAIGPSAKVDTAATATALGNGATVNKTATSGLAIGNGAVTGSAEGTATKSDNTTVTVAAAGGVNSVAIGTGATNAGNTSIALGDGASVTNDTDGNYQAVVKSDDIAIGTSAKTSASDSSTAIGKSASVSQSTEAVAIGSSATASSSNDALVLGKEAKAASAADSIAMGTSAAANSADVVAIGSSTSATGANSVVIGKSAQTTSEGGNAIGSSSTASGRSTAIGQSATANNFDALAIGNGATANADRSISLGYHAGVGTTEGKGETQTSGSLIAIGTEAGNNVAGMQNIAIGSSAGSDTKSNYNVAIGSSAGYNITYSDDSNNQNGYNVSIGYKANYQDTAANIMNAISIGERTNAGNYAVAIGGEAQAIGTNSIALGYKATAADTDSMALGYNSSAANGNIAIGVGSTAPKITMSTAYLTGDAAPSTYISVGTSDNLRRISNVADGSAAQDVVTVHQLTTAYTDLENTIKGIDTTSLNTYSTTAIDSKIADVKSQIANAKTKYFSYSTSTSTLAANADNTGATATAADAMAIGPNANATNTKTLAIGNNVYAKGLRSIAIGTADNPTTDSAGTTTTHNTSAEGENSIALGTSTTAQSDNSVAIGTRAQTYTTDTTKGSITGVKAVAIGYSATTAGDTSVAVGNNATVKYASGTAVGTDSLADGTNAVAIGEGSKAYSDNSTAIGQGNSITGNNTYGLGSSNTVSGAWGSVTTSGVSGYNNSVTSVSDANTMNAISGIYITGNSNSLTQNVVNNVVSDITAMGSSNTIDAGAGGTSSHSNTLSQIAIVGSGNTVQGKSSDDSKTNNIKDVTILGYNNKVDANTDTTVDFSNTQILGSNVTAKLGNSVYLGSNAAYTGQTLAASDAITSARTAADAAAEASDAYKAATTDAEKAQIKAQYEAQYLYQLNVQAMEAKGTTAGTQSYSTDETYGDGTSYTYAGSSPAGVVTVGSVGAERRIQNVAAGLVSATSTDAVNGSQLYALTRQLRFGGDNSSFGTTTADDRNVVARGSNETLAIIGGETDSTKLTDNNIGVMADSTNNTLMVKLDSDLKKLNTASLGSGSGDSYKESIKLDGTNGKVTVADTSGTVKTTMDTTGLTITNGPKFTSSGIDAASQKITSVEAGEADTDAANVGQVKAAAAEATTEVKAGTNASLGTVETSAADKHKIYTVNVDNLAVKANGTGTTVALANGINFKNGTNTTSAVDNNGNVTIDTKNLTLEANGTNKASVSMDGGINFKNGTNTTATVDTDGTVTISATHNKLESTSYTASNPSDSSNKTTLKLKDTDGNETTLNLTDTYTTVSKNTDHTIAFKRNDGSNPVSISLDDLNGASKEALTTAAAKATSEVTNGTNVASVTKTAGSNGQNIYTVNVDDLSVKTTDGEKKSVHLADGLVFADGTNTTATVGDNGTIKFNVSNDAIKKQAVQAIDIQNGSNVTVTPVTNADGTVKTFTIAASDLKYSADGTSKTTSLANGISFAAGANTTAEIDDNGAIKINATHNKLNAAGTATKATADSNAVTLTLNDADGNTTTTALTDTYTTISKDGTNRKVTFKRNDGETQILELSDLGGITAAQDKYVTSGTVSYDANGNGTASLTGNNGLTASITGLKDTKVSSGAATYVGTQGDASGSATLTMNDGTKAAISGLKDDYITSASVGTETNHVTMNRLGGGTVDLNLNPILEKYSLSDYRLVGNGNTQDQAYQVSADGTVTLNVVDAKDAANKKTIQITGLASQSGVNAGRTTVKSSDNSVTVSDSAANSDTHTYDIKVDYSKIPSHVSLSYTGDTGSGSNTLNNSVKFAGTTNQVTTTAKDGQVTFALASDIQGINSVTTGNTTLNTNGVSNGNMSLTGTGMTITDADASKQVSVTTSGVSMGSQRIQNVADATQDTDAATLKQVKNARTVVTGGSNVAGVTPAEGANNQMTYTVNVDNLSVKANSEEAKSVTLKNGLTFNDGTNTTASVGEDGAVAYSLKPEISLTKVTTGNSTLDTNGLTISGGPTIAADGINAGNKVISGVANGSNDTDAVNVSQLKAIQSDVNAGWTIKGKDSTNADVNANIGKGKSVTYSNGNYTKAVVTKDDSGNAAVTVDVTTGTLTTGTDGKITSADGLATTGDVASAVNGASWTIQDGSHTDNAQQVKAGDTVSFKAGDNLTLDQDGREFTYKLNQTLTNMTSVTAVDDKQNTAVLNGEGLKVTDAQGNALTQHATEVRLHDANKAADDTTTDVVLNKQGLQNGGHTITGVADGKVVAGSQEAVNGGQLYDLQQKVGSGWKITGNNTDSTTSIGADKTVSFVDGKNSTVTVSGSDSGATVKVDVDTAALAVKDSKAVATGSGVADASEVAEAINNAAWTVEKAGSEAQAQQVKAGTTVTFGNDENLTLAQNGTAFTYGLASNVNISTIRLGGTKGADGVWTGGIYIGKQVGGGVNPNDGNYITGLDNTSWDLSKVVDDRAATEGQLKAAINQVTIASQSGGFGLRDESGNTVTQMLGQTVSVVGDTEYEADGKTVKQQGNITTEADSTNVGGIKVKLNKNLDLTDQGSVTIGQSSVTSGKVVLGSDADTTKKITLDSSKGTATVGGVTINGTKKTVTGLANTTWNGTAVSGRAATEDQLAAAISQATTTAQDNELHVKGGSYDIQTTTDAKGQKQNSVTLSVVDGKGEQKDTVVINDVAKASDVGDTDNLAGDIKNKNGTTSVVDAVNNLNDKVGDNQYLAVTGKEIQNGDSSTTAIGKLNNRMNDIYSKATQHSTVSRADDNVTLETSTNADGGTDYKIGLNKDKIDLDNVTIKGHDGSITAKSVTADTFTSGNTVVNSDGVKIGDKSALTSDTLKVNGKTYVSGDGINANSQKITNVADGTADGDAVNVKQVNAMAARQDAAINQNARAINNLGREVDKLDSRIDRVGAGAAALAALNPGPYDPNDKVDFSAGYGNYRGASAAAVGMYYHPDERTIMSLGVAMGGGENMVNAGVTWKLGRRTPVRPQAVPVAGAVSTTPAIPVKTAAPVAAVKPAVVQPEVRPVAAQPAVIQQTVARPAVTSLQSAAATNAQLMDLLARQTAILERLSEQKAAPAAAPVAKGDDLFPDVPENHWAYSFVSKLAQAGVLKGTPVAQAAENPLLTRNDFAQILYAALKNGATTNPALNQDGSLNKLASEFKAELKNVKK
ncbi:YadA-like family protein [Acidaminococcus timonensis]|uniref:YadA-like family protein n=1 Tax=Acidaminococcus timonensis TaxID=1871002 RepID=UPI0025DBEA23|nr:YadA-like family protein [Acidaminococcus timonensis]